MSSEVRPCLVKRGLADKPLPATFLRFGDHRDFDESNNPFTVTVAIVELEDGRVLEVAPSQIKFVK
ncbi:hypothetical protein KW437_22010 [Vibrio fluvialis]|nr:hypothetical protein [Vibrio fluvialis]